MKVYIALRWSGIAINTLLVLGTLIGVLLGEVSIGALIALLPFALVLLALIPVRPSMLVTILAALANALFLLIGLFSAYGLEEYVESGILVALVWAGAVGLPAINIAAVWLWRMRATRPNI